jgi:hypothetical protein
MMVYEFEGRALTVGTIVAFRIEKNRAFVSLENGKEQKYLIVDTELKENHWGAETMTGDVIKENARDTIWHIRMAAEDLEHSISSWLAVAWESTEETLEDVKSQRIRCMNIIGELCGRLGTVASVLSGDDIPFPLRDNLRALIELCDERMKDLQPPSLRDQLEEQGRQQAEERCRRGENPESTDGRRRRPPPPSS